MARDLDRYFQELERARRNRKAALDNFRECDAEYQKAFVPIGGKVDIQSIERIYAKCPEKTGFPRSYILIYLVLLLYSPESLYGGKIPLFLAKMIAKVLGIKAPSVYIARRKVVSWMNVYPDFFRTVFRIFEELTQDDKTATQQ